MKSLNNTDRIIVIGGGGHSKVVISTLLESGSPVLGYTDFYNNGIILGVPYLGTDAVINDYQPLDVLLCIGMGSVRSTGVRKAIFEKWKAKGYSFATVIHPTALVSKEAQIAEGVQLLMGATVQTGVRILKNCIINTGCIIEHDCEISPHVHVSPGCILLGNVSVNLCSHIGAGSIILQGLKVGSNVTVGAGAVVTKDVDDSKIVVGVPAREVKEKFKHGDGA